MSSPNHLSYATDFNQINFVMSRVDKKQSLGTFPPVDNGVEGCLFIRVVYFLAPPFEVSSFCFGSNIFCILVCPPLINLD